jgi:hypothetical protein
MAVSLSTEQERELGGLLLSAVQVGSAMQTLRAADWRNRLSRVGLPLPFFLVHDLGLLFLAPPDRIAARTGLDRMGLPASAMRAHAEWIGVLNEIAATEMIERARAWKLRDDLVAVVLLRVLAPVYERFVGPGRRPVGVSLPLDPEAYAQLDTRLPVLFRAFDRQADVHFLMHLSTEWLRLVTALEQIDLDTLRLLGMFGAEASAAGAFGMLDLLGVLESPEANDVVNFSLDLLPSVLETKRRSGMQSWNVDGYSGLARRGTLDSLMLSELAQDDDLFDQRFSENEVFYYAHEKSTEEDRRLHYLAVDATASMRGQRSVFARGLALTLAKKLLLRGDDVFLRFFDSRLHDVQQARARRRGKTELDVPYVLSFKGEHGRNYAKVFGLLAGELARTRRREKKSIVLYLLTHAECHVPLDTIERLRDEATLYGVFMLPSSGELDLEYLPRLHTVQIVNEQSLGQRDARAKRALDIVDHAAEETRNSLPPRASKPGEDAQRAADLDAARKEVDAIASGTS